MTLTLTKLKLRFILKISKLKIDNLQQNKSIVELHLFKWI